MSLVHLRIKPGQTCQHMHTGNHTKPLTDTAMLISELTRFDSFYIFSTELLVFLLCRQTDKEFRLPWPSFVRVEIYYRYWMSINRKYWLPDLWILHSEVVRASASRPMGHEFESRTIHFPYHGFFLFPCLSFFFSISKYNKHCGNLYWKYDNTGFAMEKKPSFFIFSKLLIPHIRAQ